MEIAALARTAFLDFDHPEVAAFASRAAGGGSQREQAVRLYYAVRDGIRYDPYSFHVTPEWLSASRTLATGAGWCVPKAVLLAACCRARGIPARLGFADVKNHLATERLLQMMGSDLFIWHGYVSMLLDGRWVKATPAFNIEMCRRFDVLALEFDGTRDSLLQPFDAKNRRHMEYVRDRGLFDDLPYAALSADMRATYPRLIAAVEAGAEALRAPSPLELDGETMRTLAGQVTELVVQHLATLREQPAQHSMSRAAAEKLLGGPAPEEGEPMEAILAGLREKVIPYHAREPHPRFIGYVPSCPTFPGVLGDFLGAGFNFFSGVWPISAGANQIELTVLDWFRSWLGMPEGTSGLFTSGGSSATLTAVVAARDAALDGDPALLPRLSIYTSEQAHSSVARAGWIAGIARAQVRAIAADDAYRMKPDALARAIAADRAAGLLPFLVVASAGTTNTGAVDPLPAIADLCEAEKLWLHVDAAYAGFAALTTQGKAALRGLERADSVTLDPHKWLFVPFECGCLLARNPRALEQAFSVHPEYLADVRPREQAVNFADYGEQLTRGPRALKVWLSVRYFGTRAIGAAIERGMGLAAYAEELMRERGFEILSPAQFGVLCFRRPRLPGESEAQCNARNEALNARVNGTGQFLLSSTVLRGKYALRICTHGYRTSAQDMEALVAALAS